MLPHPQVLECTGVMPILGEHEDIGCHAEEVLDGYKEDMVQQSPEVEELVDRVEDWFAMAVEAEDTCVISVPPIGNNNSPEEVLILDEPEEEDEEVGLALQ